MGRRDSTQWVFLQFGCQRFYLVDGSLHNHGIFYRKYSGDYSLSSRDKLNKTSEGRGLDPEIAPIPSRQ